MEFPLVTVFLGLTCEQKAARLGSSNVKGVRENRKVEHVGRGERR
jgi:hypothetical protein